MHYVYIITNSNSRLIYVGVTDNLTKRMLFHLDACTGSENRKRSRFYRDLNNNPDFFSMDLLTKCNCDIGKQLCKSEHYWIYHLDTTNPLVGYNKVVPRTKLDKTIPNQYIVDNRRCDCDCCSSYLSEDRGLNIVCRNDYEQFTGDLIHKMKTGTRNKSRTFDSFLKEIEKRSK